ncbi:hypothetical protein [Sphingomonas sp. Leaf37]|uniref:hypothetical protein n=1 Tax=Sphingomonas sp. Leaf37 TaxID=2876552 RepID=UPI001E44A139|nr:hypothetical protein [Sphingomonas sp. Leaf37]
MKALRIAQAIGALLCTAAVALLPYGYLRLPIAMLCIVCLILFASVDALRGVTVTPTRKSK